MNPSRRTRPLVVLVAAASIAMAGFASTAAAGVQPAQDIIDKHATPMTGIDATETYLFRLSKDDTPTLGAGKLVTKFEAMTDAGLPFHVEDGKVIVDEGSLAYTESALPASIEPGSASHAIPLHLGAILGGDTGAGVMDG